MIGRLDDLGFTDEDAPAFKSWLEAERAAGVILYLYPKQAERARAKGFEEGVHFNVLGEIKL